MNLARRAIVIFVAFMLMSLVLAGCRARDSDNNNRNQPSDINQPALPSDGFAPPIQNAPQRPNTQPSDPNRPPPERNPDGTLG